MNSQLNNEKVWLFKGKTTKSSTTFRTNKPNSPIVQTNLTNLITMSYAIFISLTKVKNKPNSNPIAEWTKMNLSIYSTMEYKNYRTGRAKKQSQNKPNQTQFQRQRILFRVLPSNG